MSRKDISEKVKVLKAVGSKRIKAITNESINPFTLIKDCVKDKCDEDNYIWTVIDSMPDEEFLVLMSAFHSVDLLSQVIFGEDYTKDISGDKATIDMLISHKERCHDES